MIYPGSRVTLADGGGRGGTVKAASPLLPGWIVAWDLSNISTHEPALKLLAAARLPEPIAPAMALVSGQLELFQRRRA